MSFGFGLGLPHHVAILGGGAPPPAETYYLSLTSLTSYTLKPYSISVDSSNNPTVFGARVNGGGSIVAGLALKLTSVGALTAEKDITNTIYQYIATQDTSGNYYAIGTLYPYLYCCGITNISEIIKLDSSLTKTNSYALSQFNTSAQANPVIDSSGNIWHEWNNDGNYYEAILQKLDPTFSTTYFYSLYSPAGYINMYYQSMAATSSGALIGVGAFVDNSSCCGALYYPHIQSLNTSTGALNWSYQITNSPTFQYLNSVALDSSDNIYAASGTYLFKFNSSGVLQWQRQLTGTGITSLATDAAGNVYCVGGQSGVTFIVKFNTSGTIQYSRSLTATTGTIVQVVDAYTSATVKGNSLYVTGVYSANNSAFVFKVPTDGSLTQGITVGGYSFTYAIGSVTAAASSLTTTSTPTYGPQAIGATGSIGSLSTIASQSPTTAVTTL